MLCRDLKPENVLLAPDGTVKLSDFGLGHLAAAALNDSMLQTTCGTPNYVAPEVLMRKGYKGGPADIWSLGESATALPDQHVLTALMGASMLTRGRRSCWTRLGVGPQRILGAVCRDGLVFYKSHLLSLPVRTCPQAASAVNVDPDAPYFQCRPLPPLPAAAACMLPFTPQCTAGCTHPLHRSYTRLTLMVQAAACTQ